MANEEHLAKLREGVHVWNEWRENHLEIWPDLSGAHLNGKYLRWADLSGADLQGAFLLEANLEMANLRGPT